MTEGKKPFLGAMFEACMSWLPAYAYNLAKRMRLEWGRDFKTKPGRSGRKRGIRKHKGKR